MYGKPDRADVKAMEPYRLITLEMGPVGERPTCVEWQFGPRSDRENFVTITNAGFDGSADELVAQALGSIGWPRVDACGAKAFLEHGLQLNLVPDRSPNAIVRGWPGKR
jgi:hypothetical protein